MTHLILAIIGYLLGSVNAAVVLTKTFFRKDVRNEGSGNAGATNVTRTFGWWAGVVTLGCDMLKTFLSAILGTRLFAAGTTGMCAALLGCILGHCFPVFFRFRGGKGVSVGFAIGLCVCPLAALIGGLAVFLVAALLTKRVSVGSLCGCLGIPVVYALLGGAVYPQLVLLVLVSVLTLVMHRSNIQRLAAGTEPPFHVKK